MQKLVDFFATLVLPACLAANKAKIDQMVDYIGCQDSNLIDDFLKKLVSSLIVNNQSILVQMTYARTKSLS